MHVIPAKARIRFSRQGPQAAEERRRRALRYLAPRNWFDSSGKGT
jgi:hypothetical protein